MLFDLKTDPDEFDDLGADPAYEDERARLAETMFAWARRPASRITISDEQIKAGYGRELDKGVLIGYWDEAEVEAALRARNDK